MIEFVFVLISKIFEESEWKKRKLNFVKNYLFQIITLWTCYWQQKTDIVGLHPIKVTKNCKKIISKFDEIVKSENFKLGKEL